MSDDAAFSRPAPTRRHILAGLAGGGLMLAAPQVFLAQPARAAAGTSPASISLGDFETGLDGWTFGTDAQDASAVITARFERSTARAATGSYSANLWGQFVNNVGYNVYATRSLGGLLAGQLPPPDINAISLSVYAQNLTAVLLRMVDATGQIHQQAVPLAGSDQWLRLTVSNFAGGQEYLHFGGADDGVWHGPAASISLLVDLWHLRDPTQPAQIWFDQVSAVAATPPLTLTQASLGNIFTTRQRPAFDVRATTGQVAWSVRDLWGNIRASGRSTAHQKTRLAVPVDEPGYYQLTVAPAADPGTGALRTPFAVVTPAPDPNSAHSPFGLMTHFDSWGTDIAPLLALSGAATVRDEIYWADVEQTKGEYAFPAYAETYMSLLKAGGIAPLIELDFANPHYDGGLTPYTAEGIAGYVEYGRRLLQHYGRQIRWVEIWNEYNGNFSNGPGAQSVGNYFKILQASYRGIKQIRPDVTVVAPVTSNVPLDWLEQLFELGGLDYLDTVSVHPYVYPAAPEAMLEQVQGLDALVRRYNGGRSRPIWITEIGWPTDTAHLVSERAQSQDIVRSYVLALSAGVEKIFWYDLMNDGTDITYNEHNFGLIHASADASGRYTPKPSFTAFTTLTRELSDAHYDRQDENAPNGVHSYMFQHGRTETRVIWSTTTAREVTLTVDGPVQVTDLVGRSVRYQPTDRGVFLSLTADPVYVRGRVRGISAGAPVAISCTPAAVGDDIPVTLAVDATRSRKPVQAAFDLIGQAHPVVVSARAGRHAERTVTVPGLADVGTRTVVADVRIDGHLAARLTTDTEVLPPLAMRVAPAILALNPLQAALDVTVTNNSVSQTRTVGSFSWTVGTQHGTTQESGPLAPGGTSTTRIPLSTVDAWTPYDGTVSATGLAWSGRISFAPVLRRTVTVDGTLDPGVAELAGIDLSKDGRWISLDDAQPYGGPADAGGKTWLFWDDDRLYLVAAITDDVHSQDHTGPDLWMGDSVQFAMVAGAPAAGSIPYRYGLASTPDGPQLYRDMAPAGVELGLVTAATVAATRTGTTTVYEVGLPWAETPLTPANSVFSFVMLYNDNDGPGRKGYLQWADSLGSGSPNPAQFLPCQIIAG